ncbi:MAG TPA: hypothetical protein VJ761_18720 [Ktedonobacteraceae bacterium]|nr:hypothetical protein [Ktedonobacteraceae bacterium]
MHTLEYSQAGVKGKATVMQHVFHAIAITGLVLGMLGSVYTAYGLIPNPPLQKFTVAFTLMLIGLVIARVDRRLVCS